MDGLKKEKHTILVVDDTPDNLIFLNDVLRDTYKVKVAISGEKALKTVLEEPKPELILLDIMMPQMDGYEVCRRLKQNEETKEIPVIFLTALTDASEEKKGFELGAVDYITKPISLSILLARVKTHLSLVEARDVLENKNKILEVEVQERTKEINAIQDVTIMALASLAETRDNETGNHIRRTQFYVKILAEKSMKDSKFMEKLDKHCINMLFKSAPLHDIGKVGILDNILLKPGKLTDEEFEIMKTHTICGRDAIINAEKQLGTEVDFLKCAKEIAYFHHEKWNGSGYPEGRKGRDIPLSARIMAIADVYDALISKRVYKEKMSHEEAMEIILKGKGTHFDPILIEIFIKISDQFKKIAEEFKDNTDEI